MTNVPDYSKPFDESFLDFVNNHKDVVLTQEKFQELLKKIEELEKENKRLQEQLKEANRVITSYIRNNPLEKYGPAEAYCERWGVK